MKSEAPQGLHRSNFEGQDTEVSPGTLQEVFSEPDHGLNSGTGQYVFGRAPTGTISGNQAALQSVNKTHTRCEVPGPRYVAGNTNAEAAAIHQGTISTKV